MIQLIKCNKCRKTKEVGEFYKRKSDKTAIRLTCKDCQKKQIRDYYQKDPERARKLRKKNRRKDHRQSLINSARCRAKSLKIPFSITKDDVIIPDRCPCFGTKLIQGEIKSYENSATIDQIIPGKGYVKGNIQVISLKANTMKSNATNKQLKEFSKWISLMQ